MQTISRWTTAATALLLPVAVMLTPMVAWANGGGPGGGYRHGYGMGGHGLFGPLIMILVIAAIVVAVVLIMRGTGGPRSAHNGKPRKTPQDILRERYARGDITTKDYQERLKVLGDSD
ncbi:MAG: SHOCT domain-containing protein [Alphaproteobacteria bacterium]|nr:SHOCT domain-containing protein [Alphaproteobacteria bacterium]